VEAALRGRRRGQQHRSTGSRTGRGSLVEGVLARRRSSFALRFKSLGGSTSRLPVVSADSEDHDGGPQTQPHADSEPAPAAVDATVRVAGSADASASSSGVVAQADGPQSCAPLVAGGGGGEVQVASWLTTQTRSGLPASLPVSSQAGSLPLAAVPGSVQPEVHQTVAATGTTPGLSPELNSRQQRLSRIMSMRS
jgi:hypothetical protein